MADKSSSDNVPRAFGARRNALADRLANIVLAEGLNDLALRPAAARLGTSDRMLLYYFKNKADLIGAVLAAISRRQSLMLRAKSAGGKRTPDALLRAAWAIVSDKAFVPYMRVWVEVASRSTRGEMSYRRLSNDTASSWLAWIETQLDMPGGTRRKRAAAAILAVLQGATMMEMSAPGSTRGVAALLGSGLRDDRV